jgi:hypothetical protein
MVAEQEAVPSTGTSIMMLPCAEAAITLRLSPSALMEQEAVSVALIGLTQTDKL